MGTLFFNFREGLLLYPIYKLGLTECIDNSVGNCPSQKIELGTRRCKTLEVDSLGSTKRIKKLFTVTVQARLVCNVYSKHLPVWCSKCYMVILGVVCNKPFETAKGRALPTAYNVMKLFAIFRNLEKLR